MCVEMYVCVCVVSDLVGVTPVQLFGSFKEPDEQPSINIMIIIVCKFPVSWHWPYNVTQLEGKFS